MEGWAGIMFERLLEANTRMQVNKVPRKLRACLTPNINMTDDVGHLVYKVIAPIR